MYRLLSADPQIWNITFNLLAMYCFLVFARNTLNFRSQLNGFCAAEGAHLKPSRFAAAARLKVQKKKKMGWSSNRDFCHCNIQYDFHSVRSFLSKRVSSNQTSLNSQHLRESFFFNNLFIINVAIPKIRECHFSKMRPLHNSLDRNQLRFWFKISPKFPTHLLSPN